MEDIKLEKTVQRIQQMEQYLDEIVTALDTKSEHPLLDEQLKNKWEILLDYYTNGLWLSDYERDERGDFPDDLKRGVLSQDTIYNLITEMEEWDS